MAVAGKSHRKTGRPGATAGNYEALAQLAATGLSANAAAKRMGISPQTAKKYYVKGDPSRGLPPIEQRIKGIVADAAARVDAKAAERIATAEITMLDLVDEGKKVLAQALKQRLDTPDLTLPDSLASMASFAKALHAVDSALHGKPSEIIGVQGGAPDPVAQALDVLTDAERMEIYREALPLLERLGYGREGANGQPETVEEWKARTGVTDASRAATVH